jgi:hypothetical protein
MIQQQLYEWITHPERLNRDTLYELRTLLARYPYFQTVRLLYLKNLFLLHDITFGEELRKAALYVADRKILFYLIEGERFTVSSFEKQIVHLHCNLKQACQVKFKPFKGKNLEKTIQADFCDWIF